MSRVPKKIALEDEAEDINQIARTEGLKAVAEVAAHEEQKMLVGVPPLTTMDAEQKILQIEDAVKSIRPTAGSFAGKSS